MNSKRIFYVITVMDENQEPEELEITGSHQLAIGRDLLWESINDPDILAASIKGCHEVEQVSEVDYRAVFEIGIGPFRKKLHASLQVIPLSPPAEYRLECYADGRIAGSATGKAIVQLTETHPESTVLDYQAGVSVDGALASLGPKLLGGAAGRYMDSFFRRLMAEIERRNQHGAG